MVLERKTGQSSFDKKISLIKETTLEHGGHTPTLIVEGSKGQVIIQFETIPDSHDMRAYMMNAAGVTLVRSGLVGESKEIWFISEVWMSIAREGDEMKMHPSQDLDRVEVLSIVRAKTITEEYKIMGLFFEMVRGEAGNIVDLIEYEPVIKEKGGEFDKADMESTLLAAFIEGFHVGAIREL